MIDRSESILTNYHRTTKNLAGNDPDGPAVTQPAHFLPRNYAGPTSCIGPETDIEGEITMQDTLTGHGLCQVGFWVPGNYQSVAHLRPQCPFGIGYELNSGWSTRRDVVYAFISDNIVMYIGETRAGMASRFNGYRYGNPYEKDTDNRVKLAITDALGNGSTVEIWASQPLASLALPVGSIELPASKLLEARLIDLLSPQLNRLA